MCIIFYAGLSLDGSMVKFNDDFNKAYYGKSVRPVDILVKKDVSTPGSANLRKALAKAEKGKDLSLSFRYRPILP